MSGQGFCSASARCRRAFCVKTFVFSRPPLCYCIARARAVVAVLTHNPNRTISQSMTFVEAVSALIRSLIEASTWSSFADNPQQGKVQTPMLRQKDSDDQKLSSPGASLRSSQLKRRELGLVMGCPPGSHESLALRGRVPSDGGDSDSL